MSVMPRIRKLAPDAGEVRSGTLRTPQERTVISELARLRVLSVSRDLGTERPHGLGMAVIASFPLVHILAG
jgi:hypothetical protein